MPHLAESARTTPHSGIRTMVGEVLRHPNALSLVLGEPNFPTPTHIVEAAHEAALAGRTGYAPSAGFPSLRAAIAEKLATRNGVQSAVEEVVVTTGGTGGLFTALSLLVDPGTEVLVPDPGWSNYAAIVHVLHAECRYYPVDGRGEPDPKTLEHLVSPKTRVLLINSPSNPTGITHSAATLLALDDFARAHDLWVVSDECYEDIYFYDPPVSMVAVGDRSRTVSVFTFSKTYAMTGWRVGYVLAPRDVAAALERAQEPVVSCASSISQAAAEMALRGPQDVVATMRDAYIERMHLAAGLLQDANIGFMPPSGAFYMMADITPVGAPSWAVATRLLEEFGVGVVPGAAFGPGGEGFVRISLAASAHELREGVGRIATALNQWSTDVPPVAQAAGGKAQG